jgi:pSer/pThr/pTyr-binding forkhead associated (FHA) protein
MRNEHLEILSGPHKGKKIPIQGTVSIGRNPDNTLQLEDLQISRKHAIVEQGEKGTLLRDLGSGNGTYVDSRSFALSSRARRT